MALVGEVRRQHEAHRSSSDPVSACCLREPDLHGGPACQAQLVMSNTTLPAQWRIVCSTRLQESTWAACHRSWRSPGNRGTVWYVDRGRGRLAAGPGSSATWQSAAHRLERVAEHGEGAVETLLASAVGLVVGLRGHETEQLVELVAVGTEDDPVVGGTAGRSPRRHRPRRRWLPARRSRAARPVCERARGVVRHVEEVAKVGDEHSR